MMYAINFCLALAGNMLVQGTGLRPVWAYNIGLIVGVAIALVAFEFSFARL